MEARQVYIEAEITATIRMHVPKGTSGERVETVAKELLCHILPQSGEVNHELNDAHAEFYLECSDSNMTSILEKPDF